MISKALEAAARALYKCQAGFDDDAFDDISPAFQQALAADAAEVIHAFAHNITDEMIDAFFETKIPPMTGDIGTTRAREGIRAAILKGLE